MALLGKKLSWVAAGRKVNGRRRGAEMPARRQTKRKHREADQRSEVRDSTELCASTGLIQQRQIRSDLVVLRLEVNGECSWRVISWLRLRQAAGRRAAI